jgi:hypothetical protein
MDSAVANQHSSQAGETDSSTGLTYFRGNGMVVVALPKVTGEKLRSAFDLLRRLRGNNPLVLGALSLGTGASPPPAWVESLARAGISVVDVHAESARARAQRFLREYEQARTSAVEHFHRFLEASNQPTSST